MTRLPVIGLIPAAGQASRLGPIPCSKELLPTGYRQSPEGPVQQVACRHLLGAFHRAGITQAVFVLRDGKLDIPEHLTRHLDLEIALAYVPILSSRSVPESLDRAYPFVRHGLVALGFPDVVFEPADAFRRLLECQAQTEADVVLGLFPWKDPSMTDMVAVGKDGRMERIEVRPKTSDLEHNWLLALWGPRFTEFLHGALKATPAEEGELQLGTLFAGAHGRGLDIRGVELDDGRFLDLGTPEGYTSMLRGEFAPS